MKMLASQQMRMSVAMQQAMHVMCCSHLELADYLSSEIDNNPLLERQGFYPCPLEENPSLYTHLMSQAAHTFKDLTQAEAIIGSLDEKGFLREPVEDLETLKIIQGFDPIGVATKGPREALLMQLKAQGKESSYAYRVIDQEFDAFLHGRIKLELEGLDPFPGLQFSGSVEPYQIHDLELKFEEGWEIEVNETCLPSYERLPLDGPYYRKYVTAIRWLERVLQRRRTLLEKLGAILVKHHGGYLLGDEVGMQPLKMCDVAETLGVSESTVSRAVQNKLVLCPLGIKPLRFFFNTNHRAKELLKELIAHETKPLSDEKLAELLTDKGEPLARRTVAKYRQELGILPARARRC